LGAIIPNIGGSARKCVDFPADEKIFKNIFGDSEQVFLKSGFFVQALNMAFVQII